MRFFCFVLIFILLLTHSCTDSGNDLLIDDQTYQDMFVEFAIINHMDKKLLRDTTYEELVDSVYEHYGVTEEQFRYTHDYFESDISNQLLRMEKILVKLWEEREMINEALKKYESENRETADSLRQ